MQLEAIQEMTYLSTGNSVRYRRIMRIFYEEDQKMHGQMHKEEIFEKIKKYSEFSDYTMEQLQSDLDALVNWKNLVAIQDPKRVYTIEEYKNRQYSYSMSEYSVEIEKLTVKLENLFIETGSLSPNYFTRIEQSISNAENVKDLPLNQINEWWKNLQEDFQRLNQNYKDYLREFYSGRADKIMKSMEFVLHKDKLVQYLKDFVQELKIKSMRIESLLKHIPEETEKELLEKIVQSELDIPRNLVESVRFTEDDIRNLTFGRWQEIKNWFISTDSFQSESNRVMDITDRIISNIVHNASLIIQTQNWGISRKDDYKRFISMFADCENIDEAHKLSAYVFGIQHLKHYKVNNDRSTDSINSSTYNEEPMQYALQPHTRTYKPRADKTGFENKSMEKQMQKNQYLEQVEKNKNMVTKYIRNNRLDISDIDECISEDTRTTLLRWISLANMTNSKTASTEFGRKFHLVKKDGQCTLKCTDGDLVMPKYVMEFEEV
ncbi:MAG: TIGR02677 family protein [Clostridia bacterium]|nr:TIGR02677 family protein [Clostridia bacterium]